ncbi:MAG: carbamoyltransferase HypF [Proteobacteria bacterium]|nr:carbamoyltransferase HypF [Pseudomonadota bacterium]
MKNFSNPVRVEIIVLGTVQGVGFRPFVYRLAKQFALSGTIVNTDQGVVIEAQGEQHSIQGFTDRLSSAPPPLAHITSLQQRPLPALKKITGFSILTSICTESSKTLIPADIALCQECLQDILDPNNRRFEYPFTNCTNCGPRLTIVESIPYDRPSTSMRHFPFCSACREEYENPEDRRFHAQPNACPDCGPQVSWHDNRGTRVPVSSPLGEAAQALRQGKIVALRGLGGFHLTAAADLEQAIERLRQRKGRKSKPLAVMAANMAEAERICHLNPEAVSLLSGAERPIVLLPRKKGQLVANLTPGIDEIGVMLPYTPLHQLLFQEKECPQTLVMTSGNMSGAPIFTANDAAVAGLSGIADCFLLHNREIVTRVDDSVARITPRGPQLLRRARGYVPAATPLPWPLPPLLACGSGLKSTFCLTRDQDAFLSQHIGDLFNLESLDFYKESISHFKRLLQVEPVAAVCDLHPDYLSSRYAKSLDLPLYAVQHHHAHVAAVLVEHGIQEKVLALVLDGTGLGDDNTVWGGEILEADCFGYRRIGSLSPMLLPGGDAAAQAPWRMGLSLIHHAFGSQGMVTCELPQGLEKVEEKKRETLYQMMSQGFNCPLTSSCGRLFDGIAALLGICLEADYEGQAAMELEALATQAKGKRPLNGLLGRCSWKPEIELIDNRLVLQQTGLIQLVLEQMAARRNPADIALEFHLCLIQSLSFCLRQLAEETGISRIVLTGGCMQNRLLLEGLFILLKQEDFTVHTGEKIPVNDGGISLGQVIIGGLRHVSGSTHESY